MLAAHIEGIAFWSPAWPGWDLAAAAFRGQDADGALQSASRPAPALLAANERRRAPDTVLVALQVASQALADAGLAVNEADREHTADLASVFVSTHGDLPITDAMCTTLAANPLLLSPTRFHHSVHNAASGYWAIASGSHGPSTALSAHTHSFAVGLLEALSQCMGEQRRVLLVAYDTAACGALASVNTSRGLLGVALLLAPVATASAAPANTTNRWQLQATLQATLQAHTPATGLILRSPAAQLLSDNAMAAALPLMEALAQGQACALDLPLSDTAALQLQLQPILTLSLPRN